MLDDDVQRAVPVSANVVLRSAHPASDFDPARAEIEALYGLPRPTLVTCRTVARR